HLRQTFGLAAPRYRGRALPNLEPPLKSRLAGAWHYLTDGPLRPDKLLSSWRNFLISPAVAIQEHCEFQGFIRRENRADAIRTSTGEMTAEAFGVAAGAWTPRLKLHLGCRIPIQPGKGYSLTMARPKLCPRIPLIF